MSTSLRDVVEAALRGRDDRLVAKCDVLGILAVFERCDIYDVPTLAANMDSSFAELRKELEPVAAQSFLALLKATVAASLRQSSPSTPSSAPPTAPQPPFCPSPLHPPSPPITAVPLVITIKMNGKVLCERTTLPVPPTATWESVARTRLEAVLDAAEVQAYMSMPLAISLFPTATHSPSDCVRAAVSDTVAGAFMLGYPHVVVALSPRVYGCARPAARGADAPARMMADAVQEVHCHPHPPHRAHPRAREPPTHTRAMHTHASPPTPHLHPHLHHRRLCPRLLYTGGGRRRHDTARPLQAQGGGRQARL
jgi:hypothetical protein